MQRLPEVLVRDTTPTEAKTDADCSIAVMSGGQRFELAGPAAGKIRRVMADIVEIAATQGVRS